MTDIQLNPGSSGIILAQGRVGRLGRGWIILAIVVAALATCGALLMLALGPSFTIPEDSVAIVSVQPRALNTVFSAEERARLPKTWQQAIAENGRWPVLLGAVRHGSSWEAYALVPRWISAGDSRTQTKGLVRWIGDIPNQGTSVRYTDQWRWRHKVGKATLLAWINLRALFNGAVPSDELTPDGTFLLAWDGKVLKTTVPFSLADQTMELKQADISLNLAKGSTDQNPAIRTFLERLPLGDQTLKELDPQPDQANLWLKEGVPTAVSIRYGSALSPEKASAVLGALGLAEQKRLTLPDGTLAFERVLLPPENIQFSHDYSRYDGGTIHLEETEASLSWPLNASPQTGASPEPCHPGTPWARFSAQTLVSIAKGMELPALPQTLLHPLQLVSDRGRLVLCQER